MSDGDFLQAHDDLFKEVFAQPVHAASLLSSVLPAELVHRARWETLRVESGEVRTGQRALRTDLLFSVELDGKKAYVYVLVEHQSSVDRQMPLRMLGYLVGLWQRLRRDDPSAPPAVVLPVVVHHGPRPWKAPRRLGDLFSLDPALRSALSRHLPELEILLVDLATIDERTLWRWTLTDLARMSLWLLQTARGSADLAAELTRWLDVLRRIATAPSGVAAAITLLRYANRVGDVDPEQTVGIAQQLGPRVQEAYMTGDQRLIERGRDEGREEGRRGERLALVLRMLSLRFGPLPPSVEERLRHASFEELGTVAERLVTASQLDEALG